MAEKPKVAGKIAAFIGSNVVRKSVGSVGYYETTVNGKKVIVAPAVGHIFTLVEKEKSRNYPVFDIEWVPSYKADKGAYYTRGYVELLNFLSKQADELVVATDFDIEGSLIGYNVFRFCFGKPDGKRMRFSALTPRDIKEAYSKLETIDLSNAYAGEARHILDWYFGINLSRALMSALIKNKKFKIMSTGRVQGPALAILAERELEIKNFVPTPYWEVFAYSKDTEFKHEKDRFLEEAEAKSAFEKIGKEGKIDSVEKEEKTVWNYPPFDLTSLQLEAYKLFGFAPSQTLSVSQSLYENSYISYPRTSSQKLPYTLGLEKLIRKVSEIAEYKESAEKLIQNNWFKPYQGKKDDPAHPAIHPTGIYGKMDEKEKKLYDLIVRRFLSVFAPPGKKLLTKVILNSNDERLSANGAKLTEPGWTSIYGNYYTMEDKLIAEFLENEKVKIDDKKMEEKETKPSKRYTQASLISELEKRRLGTKATRSVVIDTLFNRDYIKGRSLEVTDFGMAVYSALKKDAPRILDEELTKKIEDDMEKIQTGEMKKEEVIEEGRAFLAEILSDFKQKEMEIGKDLASALEETEEREKTVGKCNLCGGSLRIISYKGSNFIGCSGYPECRNSFPLPGYSLVRPTGKVCKHDGMPIVLVLRQKMRFEMCIAKGCPSKANWGKKKEEKAKSTKTKTTKPKKPSKPKKAKKPRKTKTKDT
ncbi:DNA topoisomerase I [Candidatus Micrarchaeota archaeon]|nr:DNA topoisomerase I [Candidatus Micrarchaeota archaeon]